MVPLYRWYFTESSCWLDSVSECDGKPGTILFNGKTYKEKGSGEDMPISVLMIRAVSEMIEEFYFTRSEHGKWRGDGVNEINVFGISNSKGFFAYIGRRVRFTRPSIWLLLHGQIADRMVGEVFPHNYNRVALQTLQESRLSDLNNTFAERRARQLALQVLKIKFGAKRGERLYQKYRKHGFITVKAKSGKFYCIKGGTNHTGVWEKKDGKKATMVDSLCLYLDKMCFSDQFVMRLVTLLSDEEHYNKCANHSPVIQVNQEAMEDGNEAPKEEKPFKQEMTLVEMVADLKSKFDSPLRPISHAIAAARENKVKLERERLERMAKEAEQEALGVVQHYTLNPFGQVFWRYLNSPTELIPL